MAKAIEITTDTWATCMTKLKRMDGSMANFLQRMMMFAFQQYADGHNSNWLSEVIVVKYKSVRGEALKLYAEAHTDLKLMECEDGEYRFKRDPAKEGKPSFIKPEVTWYEFSKAGTVTVVKPDAVLKRTIKTLKDALDASNEKKSLESGNEDYAKELIAYLQAAPTANAVAA